MIEVLFYTLYNGFTKANESSSGQRFASWIKICNCGERMLKDYFYEKPTIESERLIIRPFKPEDVNDLKEWTPNKEIYKYWGKNPGKADLKPELLLEKLEKPSKSFHLYIEYKENNKVIGDLYIYLIEKDKKRKSQ